MTALKKKGSADENSFAKATGPTGEPEPGGSVSAGSLLLTLFGEFVFPANQPVWTAPLLKVLGGVGIAEKAARQGLNRASAAGWIESQRDGRRTSWQLTAQGLQLIADGSRRVRTLRDRSEWDGQWVVLHVSLPEAHRANRLKLYRALSWAGFGSPTPGIWICPHAGRQTEAGRVIEKIGVAANTIAFAGHSVGIGLTDVQLVSQAWDLEKIAARYGELLAYFETVKPAAPAGVLSPYIQLVNAIQRLPSTDPGLPDALLPKKWSGTRQAAKLMELRVTWKDQAHAQWAQLVAELDA